MKIRSEPTEIHRRTSMLLLFSNFGRRNGMFVLSRWSSINRREIKSEMDSNRIEKIFYAFDLHFPVRVNHDQRTESHQQRWTMHRKWSDQGRSLKEKNSLDQRHWKHWQNHWLWKSDNWIGILTLSKRKSLVFLGTCRINLSKMSNLTKQMTSLEHQIERFRLDSGKKRTQSENMIRVNSELFVSLSLSSIFILYISSMIYRRRVREPNGCVSIDGVEQRVWLVDVNRVSLINLNWNVFSRVIDVFI